MRAIQRSASTAIKHGGSEFMLLTPPKQRILLPETVCFFSQDRWREIGSLYPSLVKMIDSKEDNQKAKENLTKIYVVSQEREKSTFFSSERVKHNNDLLEAFDAELLSLLYQKRKVFHPVVEVYIGAKRYYDFCLESHLKSILGDLKGIGSDTASYAKEGCIKSLQEYTDKIFSSKRYFAIKAAQNEIAANKYVQKASPFISRISYVACGAGLFSIIAPEQANSMIELYSNKAANGDVTLEMKAVFEMMALLGIAPLRYLAFTAQSSPKASIPNLIKKTNFSSRMIDFWLPETAANKKKDELNKKEEEWKDRYKSFSENTGIIAPLIWYASRVLSESGIVKPGLQQAFFAALLEALMAAEREHKVKQEIILSKKINVGTENEKTKYDLQTEFFAKNTQVKMGFHLAILQFRFLRDFCFQYSLGFADSISDTRKGTLGISALFAAASAFTESMIYEVITRVNEKIENGDINEKTSFVGFMQSIAEICKDFVALNSEGNGKDTAIVRSLQQPMGRVFNFLLAQSALMMMRDVVGFVLNKEDIAKMEEEFFREHSDNVTGKCDSCGDEKNFNIENRESGIRDSMRGKLEFDEALTKINDAIIKGELSSLEKEVLQKISDKLGLDVTEQDLKFNKEDVLAVMKSFSDSYRAEDPVSNNFETEELNSFQTTVTSQAQQSQSQEFTR